MFASQHGLFFLEISTLTRKNIELVLKVMRIRTVHLLKKLQVTKTNSNASSSRNSTDFSSKGTNKENMGTSI